MGERSLLLLLVLLLIPALAPVGAKPEEIKVYIYGEMACSHCAEMKKVLESAYGSDAVIFKDITEEACLDEFLELYELLDLGEEVYIPLVIVFYDGVPRLAIVGERSLDEIERGLEDSIALGGLIVLDLEERARLVEDEEVVERVVLVVTRGEVNAKPREISVGEALPIVISMAVADSVNPCTFSVFTAMLLMALAVSGRKKMVAIGLPFVLAIYVAYFAMGLGLIRVFYYVPFLKYAIGVLALLLGSTALVGGLGGSFRSPVPLRLRKLVEASIERALNPLSSAAAGFVASVTLLPCTSGPYLVAAAILAKLEEESMALPLLALYNSIFVAPLVAVLLGLALLSLRPRTVKIWRSKRLHIMEAVSGALLVLVSLYLLLFT